MEKRKKNKTDKERLVASTDVQDTPAFGLQERPPHLEYTHSVCRRGLRTPWALATPVPQGSVLRAGGHAQQPREWPAREPRARVVEQKLL